MKNAFVCGHPVAHSRSPLIHGYWLRQYGIDAAYEAIDIAPDRFGRFCADLPGSIYAGGNITVPHKEAAYALVAKRTDAAEMIGAVNTIWISGGELHGGNTDADGFSANLDEFAPLWRKSRVAVVLGAGGAARAVLHALFAAGVRDIRIINRTRSRALALRDRFNPGISVHEWPEMPELLGDCDLVVNTTTLGMGGETAPPDLSRLPDSAIVTDIVYVPLETPLLREARLRGLKIVDGLGMLLHQAAPGFERWFGKKPAVTRQLRDMIVADLEAKE